MVMVDLVIIPVCTRVKLNAFITVVLLKLYTRHRIGLFCCGKSGCDRSYSNKGSLTRHLKLDHGHVAPESENARFVCEVCNKKHKRAKELIKHYETHGVNIGMSLAMLGRAIATSL